MQITDVRVRRIENQTKLKAVVSVVIEEQFVVHDFRVVDGVKGLFVAMPSKKTPDGEYKDIAHAITPEARDLIQKVVLQAYQKSDMREAGD